MTQIDECLTIVARVTSWTRTVDGAVESRATQTIILACGRIAQVDERVASRARVAVGTQALETVRKAQTSATIETDNAIGVGRAKVDGRLTIATRIANRTIAVVAILIANTSGIVSARVQSAHASLHLTLIDHLETIATSEAEQTVTFVVVVV